MKKNKANTLSVLSIAFLAVFLVHPTTGQASSLFESLNESLVKGTQVDKNPLLSVNVALNDSKTDKKESVDYQVPTISGEKNTKSADIKTKVKINLPRQRSSEFYEDMSFQVNLSEYSQDLTAKKITIKMTDEATDKDISSYFPEPKISTSAKGETVLTFSLSKKKLKILAESITDHDIVMNVEITVPLTSNESIKGLYDESEKGFKVPVPINHETLGGNTSKAFVGMQLSADPVRGKEVSIGTSTDDLNAKDYVENVESLYPDDKFTYSFKEKVDFTEAGTQKVNVVVKSNNTDVEKPVSSSVYVYDPNANPAAKAQFADHPYTTLVDDEGRHVSGKSLPEDMSGIIPLKYMGNKLADNLYVKPRGKTEFVQWDGKAISLQTKSELMLNKVGNVKGKYIKAHLVLEFTDTTTVSLDEDNGRYLSFTATPAGGIMDYSIFSINLLDENDAPVTLANAIFPISKNGPTAGSHLNADSAGLINVIAESSKGIYKEPRLQASILSRSLVGVPISMYDLSWVTSPDVAKTEYNFNLFYNNLSSFRAGVAENKNKNTSRVYGFFDKLAPIYVPIAYSAPTITGGRNIASTDIKSTVQLYLPRQSTARFYEDMSFQVNLSKYSENLTSNNVKIKMTDETKGADLSSYFPVPTFSTSAKGEKLLDFSLTKENLKALADSITDRDIIMNIEISAPMDSNESNKEIYDSVENGFKVPISVNHELLGGNSSNAFVGMNLSAEPAKGKQGQRGQSTDDLNAEELIETVKSLYPNDEFTYSFKEKVEFTITGPKVVNVVVKSNNTDVEIVVPVELTIVDNPLVFVTVTEAIDLKQVNKMVIGEGKVGYTGPAGVNIDVDFPDPVKLTNSEQESIELAIFNENKTKVQPGQRLALLNKTKPSAEFSMNAPKANFKKVDIYYGSMLVNFTIK